MFFRGHDGVYAPLTKSGTIIVAGTIASTYASPTPSSSRSYHALFHLAMAPARLFGLPAIVHAPAGSHGFAVTTSEV